MVARDCAWSPVVFMVIMVISGYQWLSVVISGFLMVTRDCAWSPVVFMVISGYMHGYCGYQWLCMVISGYISVCMHGVCGYICTVIVVIYAWLLWLSVVVCMATQVPCSSWFMQIQKPPKMCVLVWYAK